MKNKRSINKFLICSIMAILLFTVAGCSDATSTNSNSSTPKETTAQSSSTNKSESASQTETSSPIKLEKAKVTHHTDGDTIGVTLENGQYAKVRFIGVNTPESTTKHEQYGEEASNYTKSQLYGKTVYLESDAGTTDKYGRLLRYVWLSPPTAINESEIRAKMFNAILAYNGYAEQMTIQPNVKYADYFKKFCAEARQNSRGLWAINPNGTTKGDGISAPSSSQNSNNTSNSSNTNTPNSASSLNSNNNQSSSTQSTSTEQQKVPTQTSTTDNKSMTVYVTKTGHKYHRAGCKYLARSQIPISLGEAESEGYTPCSICDPPQ
ncbi:thermonuclease family protein [Clostridium tyrobutyricum]|uniref:thermonuclease family protein n=1 Tax=Clostridium tyrobutyricum TaxID=1519 RepID=UPI001C3800D5|nr:thermonuclease family protein [Clostridium tyrobutyricum]MBV4450634.1 thermonuclease family protein [Clostridium tyrobutyricum]